MNSFWINNFKTTSYDSLDENLNVDGCSIGGGITGISCGYYLAKNNLKVCILEKDKIMDSLSKTFKHRCIVNPPRFFSVIFFLILF